MHAEANGPPWGSEGGTVELGLFGGVFIPSSKHELFDNDLDNPYQRLARAAPDMGLRFAYIPWRVLGLEIEGAFVPTKTRDTHKAAYLWAARGHLILQAPTKTIVPFLLAGGGFLGIGSRASVLGNDVDGEFHAGIGAKAFLTSGFLLRLDVRDNLAPGLGHGKIVQHWEALLGLSLMFGRSAPPPPPPPPLDSDRDGVADVNDQCPQVAGVPPVGCPPDSDGDGIADPDDHCPNERGVASADPSKNGCPPPPPDTDGDGVPDSNDACPTVAGDGPDGCMLDTDKDGIPNRNDKCPDQPETMNNFQDTDGCPDELPKEVRKFTGAIGGIVFATGKATIERSSYPTLDEATKVLNDYPDLRVEISGHTDSTGTEERNLALSTERAEAVKNYFVGKGIDASRVQTRGAGASEPVGDNATKAGRLKNRRIEFKLLQ